MADLWWIHPVADRWPFPARHAAVKLAPTPEVAPAPDVAEALTQQEPAVPTGWEAGGRIRLWRIPGLGWVLDWWAQVRRLS